MPVTSDAQAGCQFIARRLIFTSHSRSLALVPPEKVHLLDVSFFTFRAYHALPPLSTSRGIPTNAVHGAAQMLERLFRTEKPTHVQRASIRGPVSPRDLFRLQGQPKEPDEDLRAVSVRARRPRDVDPPHRDRGMKPTTCWRRWRSGSPTRAWVVVVTGDKDLMQCVNDRVVLYDPTVICASAPPGGRAAGVCRRAPWSTCRADGDSIDNIPGVPGVGPERPPSSSTSARWRRCSSR